MTTRNQEYTPLPWIFPFCNYAKRLFEDVMYESIYPHHSTIDSKRTICLLNSSISPDAMELRLDVASSDEGGGDESGLEQELADSSSREMLLLCYENAHVSQLCMRISMEGGSV